MIDILNEHDGAPIHVEIEDTDGQPKVPTTAHWRLRCETTSQNLTEWTAFTPTQETDDFGNLVRVTGDFLVAGSLNVIRNAANLRELKRVLVVCDKDLDGEWSARPPAKYYVQRERGRV